MSAVGLVVGGSACAAHESGTEGNSKVNPGGWESPIWTSVLEENLWKLGQLTPSRTRVRCQPTPMGQGHFR